MKKIIYILICLQLFFLSIVASFAHPLDISISTASIKNNTIDVTSYFHSFEIEYLLKENNIKFDSINDYFQHWDIIADYIWENIQVIQNNSQCDISKIDIKQDQAYKILSDWLEVNYQFFCKDTITDFNFIVEYFTQFPLQTNRFTFYNFNNGIKWVTPFYFKVFTSKIIEKKININDKNLSISKDTDRDWLSDEEEKIYYTDIYLYDTDGDFYTDKEEVEWGWNPINPELWPGQEYRTQQDLDLWFLKNDNLDYSDQKRNWIETLSDYWYASDYLKNILQYLDNFFTNNQWNIFWVFMLVFFLGFIHAIWPGHSKSLLIAYTLEKNNWYFKWFLFAIIFTITHILDILLLFLVTKILIWFVDISKFNYYIQLLSSIFLFFLWIYLFIKAIKRNKYCENKKENKSLWIAFFAWLAPCSFAWSIFLLLIALWKSQWIFLLVWALWAWIFTTLVLIVCISVFLKSKSYKKFEQLETYSNVLSSAVILLISIILLIKVL